MAETTKIAWCDHTFSPWHGCQKVSPGCANCYAEPLAARYGRDVWGPSRPRHLVAQSTWMTPYSWDRRARADGVRRRVFCGSMCDVFEDRVELIGARCRLLELIKHTPNLDWLLLTKRPENVRKFCHESPWSWVETPPPNVWLGVSVEDQQRADERIPLLLQTPAAVRFLSCEPLLGPVNLEPWLTYSDSLHGEPWGQRDAIHWVIVGGESGPKHRPMDPDWLALLLTQCHDAGVPVWVKQDSGLHPGRQGRIPDALYVQQFPRAAVPA